MNSLEGGKIKADSPTTDGRKLYHLGISQGDVARYVLLPGDPERSELIAKTWDEWRFIARHREYVTYSGKYKGAEISVTSTGIGGPSAAIAIEELLRAGADTFIRVGTTGAIKEEIEIGDLIISSGAVRLDGTSKQYAIPEYPAVSSYEVLLALVEAAESLNKRYWVGITASTDSFYLGQGRPGYKNFMNSWAKSIISELKSLNVLNFEMEASTIFTMANIYGARASSICAVIANRVTNEFVPNAGVDDAVKVADEAVKILSEWDELKRNSGKRSFYPSLLLKDKMRL
ncbi:uridine phosphorylase [Fervidicoccus sp.]|uniref:uridine phosphorylase n=1 Tax=Fervidicoccus sp. TaxID=2060324 RepID=UPI003D0F8BC3